MLVTLVPAGILLLMCLWAHLRLQYIIYQRSKVSTGPETPQKTANVCNVNIFTQNPCGNRRERMTVTGSSCPRSPCVLLLSAAGIITSQTKLAAVLYSSAEPCDELSSKGKWLDLKGLWVGLAADNLSKTPCKWVFYSSPIWLLLNDAMWHWAWEPRLSSGLAHSWGWCPSPVEITKYASILLSGTDLCTFSGVTGKKRICK